jgi:hypothetical protein
MLKYNIIFVSICRLGQNMAAIKGCAKYLCFRRYCSLDFGEDSYIAHTFCEIMIPGPSLWAAKCNKNSLIEGLSVKTVAANGNFQMFLLNFLTDISLIS